MDSVVQDSLVERVKVTAIAAEPLAALRLAHGPLMFDHPGQAISARDIEPPRWGHRGSSSAQHVTRSGRVR